MIDHEEVLKDGSDRGDLGETVSVVDDGLRDTDGLTAGVSSEDSLQAGEGSGVGEDGRVSSEADGDELPDRVMAEFEQAILAISNKDDGTASVVPAEPSGEEALAGEPEREPVPADVATPVVEESPPVETLELEEEENDGYENPEFFTPKEISQMTAGFAVQIFLARQGREARNGKGYAEAVREAAALVSLSIDDDAAAEAFEYGRLISGVKQSVLERSRERMREFLGKQAVAEDAGER